MNKCFKYSLITIFLLVFVSCEIINPEESIPSYIHIDKIQLTTQPEEGTNSNKISDAWIYIDDQLIGAFELPASFPVLWEGNHNITVKAGIKVNGISGTRAIYPFYKPYIINAELLKDSVITLNPSVTYYPSTVFELKEAFEDGGIAFEKTLFSDTVFDKTSVVSDVFEGNYSGVIFLDSEHDFFQCKTIDSYILPIGDSPVFLEMNYKTDEEINVGLYANSTAQIQKLDIIYLNKTDVWNKIYINLNNAINRADNPDNFQLFFEIQKNSDQTTAKILFDNIKLIHN